MYLLKLQCVGDCWYDWQQSIILKTGTKGIHANRIQTAIGIKNVETENLISKTISCLTVEP